MNLNEKNERVLYKSSHFIDKGNFSPSSESTHWHLTRQIRLSFSHEGKIRFEQDENSRMNSIFFNDKCVAISDSDSFSGDVILNTPFYGKKKVVFFKNQEINYFYVQKIIENYLFIVDLIKDTNEYYKFKEYINSEFLFFENIVMNNRGFTELNFPFMITFKDNIILLDGDFFKFEIKHENEFIFFSYTLNSQTKKFHNFNKFILSLNKLIYEKFVFSKIKINSEDFTNEHIKILKILNH